MQRIEIEGTTYLLVKESEYLKGTGHLKVSADKVIKSLTCLELESAKVLFEELNEKNEKNDIILANIATKADTAKSVVSTMLKKLSSNEIVEYANMGSRGLRIKLLNKEFRNMIAKI